MAFYMKPGRGPMMKTGAGVPSALLQTDPEDPNLEMYKKKFPNSTVIAKGNNKKQPSWAEQKPIQYSIIDRNGNSISATPSGKVEDNSMTVKDILNKSN